jgi:chemotaxis protein methyltransferase CheR
MNAVAQQPVSGDLDRYTFDRIRTLVSGRSGIVLRDDKATLVATRLHRRLRALGLSTPREYLAYLESDTSGAELTQLLDAMSTNVTYFFREPEHFELLGQLHRRWLAEGQRRFRYWSAAASSGEEPYTLAMSLLAGGGPAADVRILATDISTAVLERAMIGAYSATAVEEIPPQLLERYFSPDPAGGYVVGDALRRLVLFRHLNLTHLPFRLQGPLDVVLCRNVMIYFDQELRSRLVREFARLLKPGGCLVISHSESLAGIDSGLEMVRPSLYLKPRQARGRGELEPSSG